ncbi:C-type lectin domain family 4 member E-like isoform X1 [Platichthys flesus]|uniref:C-type lectin domain family 4 member E-like isoform X1 n=1 Tax=Platichthys flesus TaxID=8260 RepID=UPI002DC01546|nr:C-type lectin domain family 4 member E-like isoform X1 [Platichthys flesus]
MPEVLNSDLKFKRARGNTDVATPSMDEDTYSEVKISKAQRPAELPGSKQPAASNRRSGDTSERVALLVLSVLLVAYLGLTFHENTQIKKSLQRVHEECEAKHLSGKLLHFVSEGFKVSSAARSLSLKVVSPHLCFFSVQTIQMKVTFYLTGILSGTEPCKVEQPTKPPSVREETCPRCEDCWEPHGGKRYFFSSDTLTWTQSRTRCKSMRGDLVVINNREEQKFLHSRLSVKMDKSEDKFWIGLTYSKNEGKWLWVDDTRLNTSLVFWRKGEPNNKKEENPDGEDCVMMGQNKGDTNLKIWFDKSCESFQKYICEKPEEACA